MKKNNIRLALLSTKDGKVLGPFERCMDFSEGVAAAEVSGKYGFIDTRGEFVIEPQFDEALHFHDGWAIVEKDGKKFYINREGENVLEPDFEDFGHFSEGLAWFEKDGKYGYMDKTGKVIIEPIHNTFDYFSQGFATSDIRDGKIIDKSGHEATPPKEWFESFAKEESMDFIPIKDEETGLYGFIDNKNNLIVEPQFEDADFSFCDIARVKKNGLYGYIKLPSKQWLAEPAFIDGNRVADECGFILVELS